MRRLALLPLVGALALGATVAAPSAGALDLPVSVTVVGSRSLGAVTLPTLVSGVASLLTVPVVETSATGDASWSVTARLCSPHASTPSTADCAAGSSLTSGSDSIPGTAMLISGRAVTPVGGGGTSTATAGSQDLSAARTIFANTGQSTSGTYTGVYTSTANVTLTVPTNTPAGVYTGYVVVDLVQ